MLPSIMKRIPCSYAVFLLVTSSVVYSKNINKASAKLSYNENDPIVLPDFNQPTELVYPTVTSTSEVVVTGRKLQMNVTIGSASSDPTDPDNNNVASRISNKYSKIVHPINNSTTNLVPTDNNLVMDVPGDSTPSMNLSHIKEDPVVFTESKEYSKLRYTIIAPKSDVVDAEKQLHMNNSSAAASSKPPVTGNDHIVFTDSKENVIPVYSTNKATTGITDNQLHINILSDTASTKPVHSEDGLIRFTDSGELVSPTIEPSTEAYHDNKFLMDIPMHDCPPGSCRLDETCRECF